jgi:hypothetical protein
LTHSHQGTYAGKIVLAFGGGGEAAWLRYLCHMGDPSNPSKHCVV